MGDVGCGRKAVMMKRAFTILVVLVLVGVGFLGSRVATGWFEDPMVALRELEKLGVAPSFAEAFGAIDRGNSDLLEILARAGVDMNQQDDQGNSPLHRAAQQQRWGCVGVLLDHDVFINVRNAANWTPIQSVFEAGATSVADAMLVRGADPDGLFANGDSGLIACLKKGDDVSALVLLRHHANVNQGNEAGEHPLFLAIQRGNPGMVDDLLAAGADATATTPDKQPLLNYVCQNHLACGLDQPNALSVVQSLINAGADPDAADSSGMRPLQLAMVHNLQGVTKALLPRVKDVCGTLWIALAKNHFETAKYLVEKGANVGEPRADGETPLIAMVRASNSEMVTYFLDNGADPLHPGPEGQAALPLAIVLGHEPTIMALMHHAKAPPVDTVLNHPVSLEFRGLFKSALLDFYLRNVHDITPLMAAVCLDQERVVLALLAKGANRYAPTAPTKVYPIQLAAKRENIRMQQILIGVPHEDEKQERLFVVNLSKQRVTFTKNGEVVKTSGVSSGRRSHPTPTGKFVITDKSRMHHSNIYDRAKMPYFQRLSCSAVGFHEGSLPGYAASHGCVRLPGSTARFFFKHSKVGDRVIIEK